MQIVRVRVMYDQCAQSHCSLHKKGVFCVFKFTIRNVPEKAPTIPIHIQLAWNVQYGHCYGRQQKWNNPNNNKRESRVMSFISFNIFMCHTQFTVVTVLLVLSVSHLNNCLLLTRNRYCFVALKANFSNLFRVKNTVLFSSSLAKKK